MSIENDPPPNRTPEGCHVYKSVLTLDIAHAGGTQELMANTYTQLYIHIVFSVI